MWLFKKDQANNNLPSLRSLEPSLPMPRLINGLPAFIKPADRALIKAGHPSVIRFWSSLFSIYRILKCSYKLKVGMITDPFSGDKEGLNQLKGVAEKLNFFATLPGFSVWRNTCRLAPRKFLWGQKASLTCTVAWHGLSSELYYCLSKGETPHFVIRLIDDYLSVVRQNNESTNVFSQRILDGWTIIFNIFQCLQSLFGTDKARSILDTTIFPKKHSWTGNSWGQLSLKEEAAGKTESVRYGG